MTWFALIVSVISLAAALVALRQAYEARGSATEAQRRARTAEERAIALYTRVAVAEDGATDPGQPVATALGDAANLSQACHAVLQAIDDGHEPPTPAEYARVQRCSDLLTASAGQLRTPHDGGLLRELTDELVTLHHSLVTEVRQHEEARFPFVGAKDTHLARLVLRKFDAELSRLRSYARTGFVPEPELFTVDFDTVRFVARPTDPPPGPA
jgi:hypothetical protein